MKTVTWIVRVDRDLPLNDYEKPLLEAIGDESTLFHAAQRADMPQTRFIHFTSRLRRKGIIRFENRTLSA